MHVYAYFIIGDHKGFTKATKPVALKFIGVLAFFIKVLVANFLPCLGLVIFVNILVIFVVKRPGV